MAGSILEGTDGLQRSHLSSAIAFIEADRAARMAPDEIARSFDNPAEATRLVIHNGDRVPSTDDLEKLGQLFQAVFSVNVTEGIPGVTAIPIGLENAWRNGNGRLHYFWDDLHLSTPPEAREQLVLSSFSVGTNPAVREPVAELFRSSRHGFQGMNWTKKEFRELLRTTKFVICPPGNGPDTHRSWEAIYSGAIPVVLRNHFSHELADQLPVLAVETYEDFLGLSDDSLEEIYRELSVKPREKAYAPYWIGQLVNGSLEVE